MMNKWWTELTRLLFSRFLGKEQQENKAINKNWKILILNQAINISHPD